MADFAGVYLRPGAERTARAGGVVERARLSVTTIPMRAASFVPDAASLSAVSSSAPLGRGDSAPLGTLAVAWRPEAGPEGGSCEVATAEDGSALFLTGSVENASEIPGPRGRRRERVGGSVAERLLRLYRTEGMKALSRIDGPVAVVLLDGKDGSLVLAPDRFGATSIYFRQGPGEILFATRPEAFLTGGAELDIEALFDLLEFQILPADRTLCRGVQRVPCAHGLVAGERGARFVRYWFPPSVAASSGAGKGSGRGVAGREARVRNLLTGSISRAVQAWKEPYGVFLSGGIDSSLLGVLAARARPRPRAAFVGAYEEGEAYDERKYARAAAAAARLPLREVVIRPGDFAAEFLRMIRDLGEPGGGPGLVGGYLLARAAGEEATMVLTGEGADELFGGYARLAVLAAWEELVAGRSSMTVPAVPEGYAELSRRVLSGSEILSEEEVYCRLVSRTGRGSAADFLSLEFRAAAKRQGVPPAFERFRARYRAAAAGAGEHASAPDRALRYELACNLPAVLAVDRWTTAAHGMGVRSPFLSAPLAEYALAAGTKVLWTGGRLKGILFGAGRKLLPQEVLSRRDKMGFPTPFVRWARGGAGIPARHSAQTGMSAPPPDGEGGRRAAREVIRDLLLGERTRKRKIFHCAAVERARAREEEFGRVLWGLACVEAWHRVRIDGETA